MPLQPLLSSLDHRSCRQILAEALVNEGIARLAAITSMGEGLHCHVLELGARLPLEPPTPLGEIDTVPDRRKILVAAASPTAEPGREAEAFHQREEIPLLRDPHL